MDRFEYFSLSDSGKFFLLLNFLRTIYDGLFKIRLRLENWTKRFLECCVELLRHSAGVSNPWHTKKFDTLVMCWYFKIWHYCIFENYSGQVTSNCICEMITPWILNLVESSIKICSTSERIHGESVFAVTTNGALAIVGLHCFVNLVD